VWTAAPILAQGGAQPFGLFVGGTSAGTVLSPLAGHHNVRNALAAIALVAEATSGSLTASQLTRALRSFRGVKRRQELLGIARGIRVYDDFAHHPRAVRETIAALRERHPEGRLVVAFEPRSATACRRLHQEAYQEAFAQADVAILAPLGRASIPEDERLDLVAIVEASRAAGVDAHAPADLDAVLARVVASARDASDVVLLMSNGDFGGLHDHVLAALALREKLETSP